MTTNHIDIIGNLSSLGLILYYQGNYDDAPYYHRRAHTIRRNFYPFDHIDIAESLYNIGNSFYQYGKYNEALDYYLQTLDTEEKFHSPYFADITLCLNNIGCTLDQQKKDAKVLHYYQHPLKISNILCQQKCYKEALEYYHQVFNIRESFYPSGHVDIVDSLNDIGITYMEMIEPKISRNYCNVLGLNMN
ncbi:unnamed protein product [Rotaria socialis]|uniref:Uncharacterized protein n=1 Tax=Rotaria socialis TaxID=392032 RepID=A0A819UZS2_9BILA|nr:unnamed protein product [Rotaria socialis]